MKKSFRKIALIALQIIFALSMFALAACSSSCSSCSSCNKQGDPDITGNTTTTRKEVPTDGTTPADHSAADNVYYMAYVLDGQKAYSAQAVNSTKSTGYEQVTKTWKDYKDATISGKNCPIMICSDLSYSALVKSATQSCFVDGKTAYMRNGAKPAKDSGPNDIEWNTGNPSYFTQEDYLKKYGEFSTEITVYAINDDTIASTGEVTDNGDGTYSQLVSLKPEAACWYQYGMKTRGSLKTYPEFEKIDITFTFDGSWQVIETVCEEKAKISPSALGGIPMGSTSKTTTTFSYGEESIDAAHYQYYYDYFDKYVGEVFDNEEGNSEPAFLDVLAGGFSKALTADGQQFDLSLKIGETDYEGKIYLKVENLDVSTIDVRVSLGKKDGPQDLYIDYAGGGLNVYYSDEFAMKAEISKVTSSVKAFSEWIKSVIPSEDTPETYAEEGEDEGISLESLLVLLDEGFGYSDDAAWVTIASDDLLGLGIGVDVRLDFTRTKEEDGDKYSFERLDLNKIAYNSENINLTGSIVPDDEGETITRNPSDNYADVADFADGVLALLKSETYSIGVNLDGSCESIAYINGVKASATAQVKLSDGFDRAEVLLPLNASYKGLDVCLDVYYTVYFDSIGAGDYGDVYLRLTKIGKKDVDAKVYCDISEVISAVKNLIDYFNEAPAEAGVYSLNEDSPANSIASVVNTVLGLNFGAIIRDLKANSEQIEISLGTDEILKALKVDLGFEIGNADLTIAIREGKASLAGEVPALGLNLNVTDGGSVFVTPDTTKYADAAAYVNGVHKLLESTSYVADINLNYEGISVSAPALVSLSKDFKDIAVSVPVEVSYGGITVILTADYSINTDSGNYGTVYLSIDKIYGNDVSICVYCDIKETVDAVKRLLEVVKPAAPEETDPADPAGAAYAESTDKIANIVSAIVSVDYAKIIEELKADNTGINLSINADETLSALGVSLGENVTLGTLSFGLTLVNGAAQLNATLPQYGLSLDIYGSGQTLPNVDKDKYLDAVQLIGLVTTAAEEAKAIIDGQNTVFTLSTALTVDGVKMAVDGNGQVSWKDGKIRVAVEADLTISEGEAADTVKLKLVYDETVGEDDPLAAFTVNSLGMKIYRRDITEINGEFNELITAIKGIVKAFAAEENPEITVDNNNNQTTENDDNQTGGEEILPTNEEPSSLDKLLDIVFGEINKITVSLKASTEEGNVDALLLTYAQNGTLELGATDGLYLDLNVVNDNGTEIADINAFIRAAAESDDKFAALNTEFASVTEENLPVYDFYTAERCGDFTRAIYEYVKNVLENLSVENILGTKSYTVNLVLDGAKSGIKELENIYVDATVSYTEGVEGKKLASFDVKLNIGKTEVLLSASYYGNTIYVTVYNVGDTYLSNSSTVNGDNTVTYSDGLKVKADADDIYLLAEAVVKIIKNKNLAAIIDMIPSDGGEASAQSEENVDNNLIPDAKTEIALTDILNALFTLDIRFGKSEDKTMNTLTLSIDEALKKFGLGFEIGTVTVAVNPVTHEIEATAVKEATWISLNAKAVENETGVTFDGEGYLDIGFASDLVNDVNTTLDNLVTDESGKTDVRVSFHGEIDIPVNLKELTGIIGDIGSVKIKDTTVTAGLDNEGDFYFTLYGQIQKLSVGLSVIKSTCYISLTYSNGYITLGRNVDNPSQAIYRVMTLDYLLDNLFVKGSDAPLCWWLDIGNSSPIKVWDLIAGETGKAINVSSNLSKIDEYYVFDPSLNKEVEETEEKRFALSDLINALVVNGSSVYGDGSGLVNKLNLGDREYYGIDLNSAKLLGKDFPTTYAAILRDDVNGISGISAYMNVANVLYPEVKLTEKAGAHIENFFKTVTNAHTDIKFNYSAPTGQYTEIFGCYSTESGTYDFSRKYSDVKLTVLDKDGAPVGKSVTLKHGSSVYVLPDESWNEEHTFKNIYVEVDENGKEGRDVTTTRFEYNDETTGEVKLIGYGFIIESDTIIKPKTVGASEFTFHANGQEFKKYLYSGDALEDCGSEYVPEGKVFAGWYTKEQCDNFDNYTVSAIDVEKDYYAKFLDTSYFADNGIEYSFVRDVSVKGLGGRYTVVNFVNPADYDYTASGSTLSIADYIGGYPVTEVGNGAFKAKSVKNVTVPETVTYIGAEAFMDNNAMESVTLLADTVTVGGSTYDGSGNRFAFFGTSVSGDGDGSTRTQLKLYYNKIVGESSDWDGYRRTGYSYGVGNTYKYYKLSDEGNNSLYPEGTWAYVSFTADNFEYSLEQLGIANFISTAQTYSFDEIRASAQARLNSLLASDGESAINTYTVEISGEYSLSGKVNMHVSFTPVPEGRWHKFTVTNNVESCAITPVAENMIVLNGTYYIKAGDTVSFDLQPSKGYEFKNLVTDLTVTNNTIVMPESEAVVGVEWSLAAAKHVYVRSEVAFTYNNVEYGADIDGGVLLTNAALGAPLADAVPVQGSNYTFVGWAQITDTQTGALQFTAVNVPETEDGTDKYYYAIWAENRNDGVTFGKSATGSVENIVVNGGTLHSWYDATKEGFSASVQTLTAATTRLRARMQYNLTVTIQAKKSIVYMTSDVDLQFPLSNNSDTTEKSTNLTANSESNIITVKNVDNAQFIMKFDLLEGNDIGLSVNDGSNMLTLSVTNQFTIVYRARKYESSWGSWKETGDRAFNDSNDHYVKVLNDTDETKLSTGTGLLSLPDYTKNISGNVSIFAAV